MVLVQSLEKISENLGSNDGEKCVNLFRQNRNNLTNLNTQYKINKIYMEQVTLEFNKQINNIQSNK